MFITYFQNYQSSKQQIMKITKQAQIPNRHSGRIIVDQYQQIKREREEQGICQFCHCEIPTRLMVKIATIYPQGSHRNVCAFENGNDDYFVNKEAESRSEGKMGISIFTQKNDSHNHQESPSRFVSQRSDIRKNYSALSQKKPKNTKIINLQSGSVKNLSRNKNQKQSATKIPAQKIIRNKKLLTSKKLWDQKKAINIQKFQKKIPSLNKSMHSEEYKQYFGEGTKKKGLSKIKKDAKNVWMQHSNKKQKQYKDNQIKRQLEKQQREQKLKKLQNQTEKLKKQQQVLMKQLERQKKQEREKKKCRNNSQIKRQQPRQAREASNPARQAPRTQQQQQPRARNPTGRRRSNRYQTGQESYYQQIPVNHPHRTLNFISQTINQQFEMMREQFQNMNQFFSNFVPFSNNGFVYFERDESEDYSIDSSGDSVGYEPEQEEVGLYEQQIELLPRYSYAKRLGRDDQCAICISGIKHQEMVRRLPCHHIFHSQCIDQWLKRRAACPVCRDQLGDLGS